MFMSLAVLAACPMAACDPAPPAADRGRVVLIGRSITVDARKLAVVVRGTETAPAVVRLGDGAGAMTLTAAEVVYSEKDGTVTATGRGTISLSELQ